MKTQIVKYILQKMAKQFCNTFSVGTEHKKKLPVQKKNLQSECQEPSQLNKIQTELKYDFEFRNIPS